MDTSIIYITLFVIAKLDASSTTTLDEICDIEEGSGTNDCSADIYCCDQSKCDILSAEKLKYKSEKRCCNEDDRKLHPPPTHCIRCKRCCNEHEMAEEPFPQECSKCSSCNTGND